MHQPSDTHWHSHLCPLPRFSAQVDGESNRLLAKRFLVEAYPSIYLIRAGKVYVYGGGQRSEQQASAAALALCSCLALRTPVRFCAQSCQLTALPVVKYVLVIIPCVVSVSLLHGPA